MIVVEVVPEEVSVVAVEEVAAEGFGLPDVADGIAVTSPRFAANPSDGGSFSGALKTTKVDLRNTSP